MMLKLCPVRPAGRGCRLILVASIFMLGALSANAGETITVSVNKVEIVKLDRNADIVLIANPIIADVAVESERLIFLFGLEPGETNLLILDSAGEEILTAPVVVTPILERQITVNRANVNEEATFSCLPRCAAISTPAGSDSDSQETGSSAGATSSASGAVTSAVAGGGNAAAGSATGAAGTAGGTTTTGGSGG